MRKIGKAQAIIIASLGENTSILCDGKLYWSGPITEINFHHKAGEMASLSITSDSLPVTPDEDERLKNNFMDWLKCLMEGFPAGDCISRRDGTDHRTE